MADLSFLELPEPNDRELLSAFNALDKSRAFDMFLRWLAAECFFLESGYIPGDAIATHSNENRRALFIDILALRNRLEEMTVPTTPIEEDHDA